MSLTHLCSLPSPKDMVTDFRGFSGSNIVVLVSYGDRGRITMPPFSNFFRMDKKPLLASEIHLPFNIGKLMSTGIQAFKTTKG